MENKFTRRNDMDALRAMAMLLGISFHISLAYTGKGWFVQDNKSHAFFAWLCDTSHGFRMPLFFVISGFFTAMLWQKRGLKSLLSNRFKRIFLPCIAAVVVFGTANGIAVRYAMSNNIPKPYNPPMSQINLDALKKAMNSKDSWSLELLKPEGKSIVLKDKFEIPAMGSGYTIGIGEEGKATEVVFDNQAIRLLQSPEKALEVAWENFSKGADISFWHSNGDTKRAHKWLPNEDLTISPIRAKHLVIGWQKSLKLVEKGSVNQLTFKNIPDHLLPEKETENHISKENLVAQENISFREKYFESINNPYFTNMTFDHMWFLWFLCWFVSAFAAIVFFTKNIKFKIPQKWLSQPNCFIWLIPLTMLPQSMMHFGNEVFGPDTSLGILPFPHTLFYYAIFFSYGALIFGRDGNKPKTPKRGWFYLSFCLFVIFPVWNPANQNDLWLDLLQAAFTWGMIFASIDLFRYYLSKESKIMRYISDSSYWIYLAHLPLVFIGQSLALTWEVNAFIKFTVLNILIFAILLISYHLIVRSTLLGVFLNGRKYSFFPKSTQKAHINNTDSEKNLSRET